METQKNTRENLQSVPPGDLQQRYLNQLSASEDTLEDLRTKRKESQETIRKFEGTVKEAIQRF
jgi:restriction endonuclease S subunit